MVYAAVSDKIAYLAIYVLIESCRKNRCRYRRE